MISDLNTKFSPVVALDKYLPCTKFEVSRFKKFGFVAEKTLKLLMDLGGLLFELLPPNLVRIHF